MNERMMDNSMWSRSGEGGLGWVTYTLALVTLISLCQFIATRVLRLTTNSSSSSTSSNSNSNTNTNSNSNSNSSQQQQEQQQHGDLITDLDLKLLIDNLDETSDEQWETLVHKANDSLSYSVKCCKPKDGGAFKYLSTTTFFHSSSPDTLRDFYMDNSYRKEWDKTFIHHHQLHIHPTTGTEIGRIVKKFPLLTPREYVLAWRLWQGTDATYYCYSKECHHPLAPRLKKYVRVPLFRSGWRIREVAGRNACQIKMVHQEDAGLNVDMAKMIFAKGIWSYVCKMDNAFRNYSAIKRIHLTSTVSAITFVQKVPLLLDSTATIADDMPNPQVPDECNKKKLSRKPSKKFIANGLIIAGGVICLARGHPNFSAKVAMAYMLSKLTKRREPSLH